MYQPIENYGLIGNMHTAALVGMDGSIDWLCFPRFDSPSVFAAILDDRKGGRYRIAPVEDGYRTQQLYWPGTNVLITRFLGPDASADVTDFMPMNPADPQHPDRGRPLFRIAKATRGKVRLRLECRPAFNYARDAHETQMTSSGAFFHSQNLGLSLTSTVPLRVAKDACIAEFDLQASAAAAFVLRGALGPVEPPEPVSTAAAFDILEGTVEYWQQWIAKSTYEGRWRESVHRSALVLELMAYEPTGAIVASPTTSLPEWVGGSRNWDYRSSWIRDSAFTVYGLLRVGLTDEASRFMTWIESRCRELKENDTLQTVYGIGGEMKLEETTLDHLEGYRGSKPVRIGNAAYKQTQMDIYGELMDSIYLFNKYVHPISSEMWSYIRSMVNWVADNASNADNGIWEMRGRPRHFVYSKLMCWVALDRAVRLAIKRSFPGDLDRWLKTRDKLYEDILHRGWSAKRGAFVQSYGGQALDASVLMMPMVFFMSPNDPRMNSTLEAISKPAEEGGLLTDDAVRRYNLEQTKDGIVGDEGSFNMCSFWYVEALTRAGSRDPRQLDRAVVLFEKCLKRANHVGLFSEECGPSGEALGNFPQAFTHLGLISAAFNLDRALG
ncbi:MAG: glycoside hydrolase family 15 protein [Terriglobia bacterium]